MQAFPLPTNTGTPPFDALFVVSFGGPEGMDDVMPFLENVLRGRNVPRERMLEVAHHYERFGGVSPINAQNRALISSVRKDFAENQLDLPIYWGNRNWHPLLPDTLRQMAKDGVKNALAFFTSAYGGYSGCRQYRENVAAAQAEVGESAPRVTVLRKFYNHPGFIEPNTEHLRAALAQIPEDRRNNAKIVFTAHSIPLSMAQNSAYVAQLEEACGLTAEGAGRSDWELVYQSRSGSPHQPWLEPDILDHLTALKQQGTQDVVVLPIGFISDHMEVLYDLDTEARELADAIGLNMVRAATVGTHPAFVTMIRELVEEQMEQRAPETGNCDVNCCAPSMARPATSIEDTTVRG